MTFITHEFRVSVISDVRKRVQDLGSPLRFMLRRSSLVECVSVLHGTCLQCVDFFFIHQYVQPCLSKNPKYTFYTIRSSLTLAYNNGCSLNFWCFKGGSPPGPPTSFYYVPTMEPSFYIGSLISPPPKPRSAQS